MSLGVRFDLNMDAAHRRLDEARNAAIQDDWQAAALAAYAAEREAHAARMTARALARIIPAPRPLRERS